MIGTITIKDFTAFASERKMKSAVNKALKQAWFDSARYFHDRFRDKRFTVEHARAAGYAPRKGEQSGLSAKAFFKSYTGIKFKRFGHKNPLEFSGETRKAVRSYVSLSSTSKGGKASYPGARVFNFKNRYSDPALNMNLEFRTILPNEAKEIASVIDAYMDTRWHVDFRDPEVDKYFS